MIITMVQVVFILASFPGSPRYRHANIVGEKKKKENPNFKIFPSSCSVCMRMTRRAWERGSMLT